MAITIDGTNGITQPDNAKLKLGNSNDLQIYSDGSSSRIKESGAGSLTIDANNLYLRDETGTSNYITAISGGAASLYHNNSKKLATTSTGIDVTGTVTADGLTVDDTNGALISHGYSLLNSSARTGSGSIQLSSMPSVAMLLDYHDSGTTVATVRNTYGSTSASAELSLDSGFITFNTGTSFSERMRIDSSGNVGIGTSSPNATLDVNGAIHANSIDDGNDAGIRFAINRINPYFNGADRDNLVDLGNSGSRFDDIFATNGTIQTSDRNEKQDIEELSEAEQRVAVACKGLMRKFRWKDAVEKKGDDARIHFGIIAQDLQDAFTAEGLDAGKYAMFISTTWWETQTEVSAVEAVDATYDEEGNELTEAVEAKEAYTRTDTYETLEEAPEGATERTRLGVRYPELLAFIISAI